MTGNTNLYPATPENVPDSVTRVSPAFKKEVSGVMASIILFFFIYLLMLALATILVVACVYGGIALIIAVPRIITIFAGIGLIGLGIMVFVFLVKFLFAVSRHDNSGSVEISKEEQPRLYAFIRQLTKDVQTPLPKKIYLSPDVNASVFYNSSFWSMFLPVRKNLQIGLGLVNSLNVSEFKAVMAHEFGHFSQRSMKLGSFVYNVNRIIHNLLFENTSYAGFLSGWANMDGVFAIFARLTAGIARGIQWILRQMYGVINKSYMRMSREMEFHADAVAASVSGSESLVKALRRIELASAGYNITLQKCDALYKQNKISSNIYDNQKAVLRQMAGEFSLRIEQGIPVVSEEFIAENNTARVNFKDQWASHPATGDRVKHLQSLGVQAEIVDEPAWALFDGADELQSQLTGKVYEHVKRDDETTLIGNHEFEKKLSSDHQRFSLPAAYKGFYDNRQVEVMPVEWMNSTSSITNTFGDIFSGENASLPKRISTLTSDIETLKAIHEKRIQVKTFDFDGVKYKNTEAVTLIAQLEGEQHEQQNRLKQLDKSAVHLFLSLAAAKGPEQERNLKQRYQEYFENRTEADRFVQDINKLLESVQVIFSGQSITIEQINEIIGILKSEHESRLKTWLRQWRNQQVFDQDPLLRKRIDEFVNADYAYFSGTSFFDNELITLNELCNESWEAVTDFLFTKFKSILEDQLLLVNNHLTV